MGRRKVPPGLESIARPSLKIGPLMRPAGRRWSSRPGRPIRVSQTRLEFKVSRRSCTPGIRETGLGGERGTAQQDDESDRTCLRTRSGIPRGPSTPRCGPGTGPGTGRWTEPRARPDPSGPPAGAPARRAAGPVLPRPRCVHVGGRSTRRHAVGGGPGQARRLPATQAADPGHGYQLSRAHGATTHTWGGARASGCWTSDRSRTAPSPGRAGSIAFRRADI